MRVFIEYMFHDLVWRPIEPHGITCHISSLNSFHRIIWISLRADDFVFLKRNGDNNAGAGVRASPAFPVAPELQADVEIFGCHELCVVSDKVIGRLIAQF